MELTPIFNDAARDGDNQTPIDGPSSPAPTLPSSAGASIDAANRQDTTEGHNHLSKRAVAEFQIAQAEDDADRPIRPHPGMKYRTDPEATALLEMLKAGRAKPSLNHNLKPPRRIERFVHTAIEEKREEMIAELRAERENDMSFDAELNCAANEGLELMF